MDEMLTRPVLEWLDHPPAGPIARPPGFDGPTDPALVGWLTSVLRFGRPDGSILFGPRGRAPGRLVELERWARRVGDPTLARVVGWWRPSSTIADEAGWVAPPLPTATWLDRPLAVLRPDWTPRGDCVAIDHRTPGATTTIEVAGRGVGWLGPAWTSPLGGPAGPARATFATTGAFADAYEWAFAAGASRMTRTAALIRGAGMALLLQTEEGAGDGVGEARWSLPAGVEARPDPTTRTLILSAGRGRPAARLIPLGLPESPYPTDRGGITIDGTDVVLRQRTVGPNRCLALLVSWNRKAPRGWRTLTVAEKSAA